MLLINNSFLTQISDLNAWCPFRILPFPKYQVYPFISYID